MIIFGVILNSVIVLMKLRSGKTLDVDSTLTKSVDTYVVTDPITLHAPSPGNVPTNCIYSTSYIVISDD